MTTLQTDKPMARKREKPEPERKDEAVRIASEVVRIARIVASYEEKTLSEYISEALRPIVERDHARHIKRFTPKGENPPHP